jgi:hypothetical protein
MNRRGFLLAAPALLALPELIVPKRTFFLPPVGGWPDLTDRSFFYEVCDVVHTTVYRTYRTSVDFAWRADDFTTMTYQSRSDVPIVVNGFLLKPFEKVIFESRQNGWIRV